MSKSIIPDGGIAGLDAYLVDNPSPSTLIYGRVSSLGQAGGALRPKLVAQGALVMREGRQKGCKVKHMPFLEVNEGKLSFERPVLAECVDRAKKTGSIILAHDLSRLIRADAYHRSKNINAIPTPEEYKQLRKLTKYVQLVTLFDPSLTESERHSKLTKKGNPGRPPVISLQLAPKIIEMRGYESEEGRMGLTVEEIAINIGISPRTLYRWFDTDIPPKLVGGVSGKKLKDLEWRPYKKSVDRLAIILAKLYEEVWPHRKQ